MKPRTQISHSAANGEPDEDYVPSTDELERSVEGVRRGLESMRRGEGLDAREALAALRKELFPNAPPRDVPTPQ